MAGRKKPSTTPNITASTPSSSGLTSPPATTMAKTTMIKVRSTSEAMMVSFRPIRSTKTPPTSNSAACGMAPATRIKPTLAGVVVCNSDPGEGDQVNVIADQ